MPTPSDSPIIKRSKAVDHSRAVAILLVLALHLRPFIVHHDYPGTSLAFYAKLGLTLFYKQVCNIAVPLFLLLSLVLLFDKLSQKEITPYIKKRLLRLTTLFLFWTGCQFVLYYATTDSIDHTATLLSSWLLLMQGGPPLPEVGGSVFYFLFVLLCLTLGGWALFGILGTRRLQWPVYVGLLILFFTYFQVRNWYGWDKIPYWRLDNFLVYIPLAYALYKHKKRISAPFTILVTVLFLLFAAQDHYLRSHIGSTGAYSKVSVIFGATSIYSIFYAFRFKALLPAGPMIFLSRYSLGIFALHKYWQLFVITYVPTIPVPTTLLDISSLIPALIIVLLTCVSVFLLGQTRAGMFFR